MSRPNKPSDDLLLQLVREGRHDAEIAVRLGVTTGELRERKADLRNRIGAQRYHELTGATAGPKPKATRRRAFLWGVGIAAALVAVLLVVANLFAGDAEDEAVASSPTVVAAQTARILVPPVEVEADGRVFDDVGQFLLLGTATGPIGTVTNRASLVAVELRGTSFITGSDSMDWQVGSASRTDAFLEGRLGGRRIALSVYTERPQVRLRQISGNIGPILEVSVSQANGVPVVLIRATENARPLEVRVTAEGRMLIARQPIDERWVLDEATGQRIDISGAREFGSIPINPNTSAMNVCEGAPAAQRPDVGAVSCRVSWRRTTRGYTVPADGVFSCAGARSVRYEGGGVRLEFVLVGSFANSASFSCPPDPVKAGDRIVSDGEWVILASDSDGQLLSVVVGGDGRIWVGATPTDVSCPCAPRPS